MSLQSWSVRPARAVATAVCVFAGVAFSWALPAAVSGATVEIEFTGSRTLFPLEGEPYVEQIAVQLSYDTDAPGELIPGRDVTRQRFDLDLLSANVVGKGGSIQFAANGNQLNWDPFFGTHPAIGGMYTTDHARVPDPRGMEMALDMTSEPDPVGSQIGGVGELGLPSGYGMILYFQLTSLWQGMPETAPTLEDWSTLLESGYQPRGTVSLWPTMWDPALERIVLSRPATYEIDLASITIPEPTMAAFLLVGSLALRRRPGRRV